MSDLEAIPTEEPTLVERLREYADFYAEDPESRMVADLRDAAALIARLVPAQPWGTADTGSHDPALLRSIFAATRSPSALKLYGLADDGGAPPGHAVDMWAGEDNRLWEGPQVAAAIRFVWSIKGWKHYADDEASAEGGAK